MEAPTSEALAPIKAENKKAIESACNAILARIQDADLHTHDPEVPFAEKISLLGQQGETLPCALTVHITPTIDKSDIEIRLGLKVEDGTPGLDASRIISIKGVGPGKFVSYSDIWVASSTLKRIGIGSSLLTNGEQIKSTVAKNLAPYFKMTELKSIIKDESTPSQWTSNMAQELPGYTYVGIRNKYPTFEKVEIIDDSGTIRIFQDASIAPRQ